MFLQFKILIGEPEPSQYVTTLYVCVDESGQQGRGSCYSVAGCWFVSERRPTDTLDRTKDKLIQAMFEDGNSVSELKGSKASTGALNTGISYLREAAYDDSSIERSRLPWSMNIPVGFSLVAFTPETISEAVADYVDGLDLSRVVQSFALDAVLKPLVHPEQVHIDKSIDAISVLLDSTTWKQPVNDYARTAVQETSLELETRDSQSVPGIQLADLAAYSCRRNYMHGDCGTAAGILHDLRFAR